MIFLTHLSFYHYIATFVNHIKDVCHSRAIFYFLSHQCFQNNYCVLFLYFFILCWHALSRLLAPRRSSLRSFSLLPLYSCYQRTWIDKIINGRDTWKFTHYRISTQACLGFWSLIRFLQAKRLNWGAITLHGSIAANHILLVAPN